MTDDVPRARSIALKNDWTYRVPNVLIRKANRTRTMGENRICTMQAGDGRTLDTATKLRWHRYGDMVAAEFPDGEPGLAVFVDEFSEVLEKILDETNYVVTYIGDGKVCGLDE